MNIRNSFKNQIIALLFFTSLALTVSSCKKDGLEETTVNVSSDGFISSTTGVSASSYILENALPSGYVKDGSKDYTSIIQAAVNKYPDIVFPAFPLMINDTGLKIGSNKKITFLKGSELRLKPSTLGKYNVIDIRNVSNVTLIDAVVVGDRDRHIGTSGEWGMGIGIRGSSNVTLVNPKASNCWGDGIYIGLHGELGCKNINIINGSSINNRRDGMSVISVDGLKVEGFYAGFNRGTSPQCGVNFEPDGPTDELKNIVINNITTEANGGFGIQTSLSRIYGGGNKFLDITINNHIDKQSLYAVKYSAYQYYKAGSEIITANVVFNNPSWKQNTATAQKAIFIALFDKAQKLVIKNPSVQTPTGAILSKSETTTYLSKLFNAGSNALVTWVWDPLESTCRHASLSIL